MEVDGMAIFPRPVAVPVVRFVPSNTQIEGADTERSVLGITYTKRKEIKVFLTGMYRVKFDLKTNEDGYGARGRVYKNGTAFGTERVNATTTYVTYSEDLGYFVEGDLIQLYLRGADATHYAYARNFRLYADKIYGDFAEVIED